MPRINKKKESKRNEEFDLNVIFDENNHDPNQIENHIEQKICQEYWFISKENTSQNESKNSRSDSQKQEMNTSTTEMHTSTKIDDTRDKYSHSYDRVPSISKKKWLLLQRITLVAMVSSLVFVTNIGTTIIYLKDIAPISYPRLAKLLALTKSINSSTEKSSITVLHNYVPTIDAPNIGTDQIIDSSNSKKLGLPNCYELFDEWSDTLIKVRFVIESVTLNAFGFLGLLANAIVIFTLARVTINKRQNGNHKNFDRLVICLSMIDILLILFHVIDALIQIDLLSEPKWYQEIYPHFWYPMKIITTTASQYMVVAISVERYVAICHKSVVPPKYERILFWVVTFSLMVNLPRFCEFISHHVASFEVEMSAATEVENNTYDQFSLLYHTSRLGENPEWLFFISSHEIAVIIFCLLTICFCNFKVWIQVLGSTKLNIQRHVGTIKTSSISKSRSQSKTKSLNYKDITGIKKKSFLQLQVDLHVEDEGKFNSTLTDRIEEVDHAKINKDNSIDQKFNRFERQKSTDNPGMNVRDIHDIEIPSNAIKAPEDNADKNDLTPNEAINADQLIKGYKSNCLNLDKNNLGISSVRASSTVHLKASGDISSQVPQKPDNQEQTMSQEEIDHIDKSQIPALRQYSKSSTVISPDDDATKDYFKKAHHKSTLILFGIAAIFLVCNIPRLAVKIFLIYIQGRSVQKHYNECAAAGQFHAPVAILIMSYVNHLLLVLNSSTNFIIYCCFAKRFRAEIVRITNWCRKYYNIPDEN